MQETHGMQIEEICVITLNHTNLRLSLHHAVQRDHQR
jgi:hypothetical protein